MSSDRFTESFVPAPDGLRLHARCYEPPNATNALPVVCLPGLARTTDDFAALAEALSQDITHPWRVIALDYRGRGLSDYDANAANYAYPVELGDILAVITALEAMPAIFVGTSRGGILAMLLGTVRPAAIAGVVLNDIGPVIEAEGLMRIKGYVGKLPQPTSFDDAAEILRRLFGAQFPKLTAEDWLASAHRTFKFANGRLVTTYDPKLATTLDGITLDKPLPTLWKEFDALTGVPVMVIRGALSDILSAETVAAMRIRHQGLETLVVPDQGHAPLLAEADTIARIAAFARRCDRPS
jgi:pimeloyl-ACP methyl ester carboxylesterase